MTRRRHWLTLTQRRGNIADPPLQQIGQKNSFVDRSLAGVPGSEPEFDKVPPHADTANYAQSRNVG